ncbi:MAG: metal-sensing transcriptional repressor [Lachnospiraceae bacterium]
MKKECCSHKIKARSDEEHKKLMNRLSRIEGQVRGIKGMVEENGYCIDILTQVAAVSAALNAFNKELLSNHMKSCVIDDIKNGNEETVDELLDIMKKLMK